MLYGKNMIRKIQVFTNDTSHDSEASNKSANQTNDNNDSGTAPGQDGGYQF